MTATKAQQAEKAEAVEKLREWIKPGDTVYTVLEHVSRSGMQREIRVVLPQIIHPEADARTAVDFLHPNYSVAKALGLRQGKRDGLIMGGCGMDMGFALVYNLSSVLYGKGYACLGKRKCPSNYHSNHHDTIRCPTCSGHKVKLYRQLPEDADRMSYQATIHQIQALDWTRTSEDGETTITLPYLWRCVTFDDDSDIPRVCTDCDPTVGYVPNPDGPERFDLVHADGYALRHRWL